MLAQHVDPELLSGFGEPPLSIEGQDIGKYPSALIVVYEFQELLRKVNGWRIKYTIDRRTIVVIDTMVLVVQRSIEDSTPQTMGSKHARDKRPELDISMVESGWHGPRKLKLNGLEAAVHN